MDRLGPVSYTHLDVYKRQVREFDWNPIAWKLPVPPTVAAQMDEGQRWAISAARAALTDAGWPKWNIESDRVAVILGNAIGGEKHYLSLIHISMCIRDRHQPGDLRRCALGRGRHREHQARQ